MASSVAPALERSHFFYGNQNAFSARQKWYSGFKSLPVKKVHRYALFSPEIWGAPGPRLARGAPTGDSLVNIGCVPNYVSQRKTGTPSGGEIKKHSCITHKG